MIIHAALLAGCVVLLYLAVIYALEHAENWIIARRRARYLRWYSENVDKYYRRYRGED